MGVLKVSSNKKELIPLKCRSNNFGLHGICTVQVWPALGNVSHIPELGWGEVGPVGNLLEKWDQREVRPMPCSSSCMFPKLKINDYKKGSVIKGTLLTIFLISRWCRDTARTAINIDTSRLVSSYLCVFVISWLACLARSATYTAEPCTSKSAQSQYCRVRVKGDQVQSKMKNEGFRG